MRCKAILDTPRVCYIGFKKMASRVKEMSPKVKSVNAADSNLLVFESVIYFISNLLQFLFGEFVAVILAAHDREAQIPLRVDPYVV